MAYIKLSEDEAKKAAWSYNPRGKTESERWLGGNKVRCKNYPFPALNKSIVVAEIEAGAHHGRTVAESDYFYTILLGRGEFFFYDKEKLTETVSVRQGDVIFVSKGTDYDYQAQHQNLEVQLMMNNLWDEGDD